MTMQEEIGTAAGSIWQALNTKGLAQRKKEVKAKAPLFDWASACAPVLGQRF
jgi:hypothetical protein